MEVAAHLGGLAHCTEWERRWARLVLVFGAVLRRASRAGVFLGWRGGRRRAARVALGEEEEEEGVAENL